MKNKFLLLLILSTPISSFANESAEFEVRGHYCANPYYYDGSSESGAQSDADNQATLRCYPYQMRRTSDYQWTPTGRCQNGFYGSSVATTYVCAGSRAAREIPNEPSLEDCKRRGNRPRKGC